MHWARISRKVLLAFVAVLVGALVPAAILVESWLSADLRDEVAESLRREAVVLAEAYAREAPPDAPAWLAGWQARAAARVTVIATDGRVLADSDVPAADLDHLENHATRPEVAAALAGRAGSAARRSATLDEEMMYVAVPVGAPPRAVMRLAMRLTQVSAIAGRARRAVVLAGLLAFALALALGAALSRALTGPLLAMTRAARAMAEGDFAAPLPPARDDELGDLVRALATLRVQLADRIDELRREGHKLRAVVDGMVEGVALVQDGVFTVANPAFARLIDAREVEGRRPVEAARLPELVEAIDAAAERHTPAEREAQLGARSLLLRARPLGGDGGRQAVVLLFDTTDERRLERLRRDLVANASHELRTPVAAIVGAAETLAAGAADDAAARASFVDIVLRHAHRLSRLTADLLDLSRLEAGYRPRVETVRLADAAQAVLAALRPRAEARRLALTEAVPPDLALVAERAAVEQILTNLVDNAIKYTPEGGRVTVRAEARDKIVRITVEDSGVGIPAEHLPRLFERFYRVDPARSRELGGTGLGLAIVKHLALAHGGDVAVESEVGRGSRFHVTLPRG